MEPNHLKSDELKYELLIRGVAPLAKQELRRSQLRKLLVQEGELGPSNVTRPVDMSIEIIQIESTISDLEKILKEKDLSAVACKRLQSRLCHLDGRIDLLPVVSDADVIKKKEFEDKYYVLLGGVIERVEQIAELSQTSMKLPAANVNASLPVVHDFKPVPVYKWGVRFSGNLKRESVASFLEKVNDLCEARRVSKQQLFSSAVDLFVDAGLLWFRSIRDTVSTWDELVFCLKRDFLPVGYEYDLLSEIRSRTQGPNEDVSLYILAVESMYRRLGKPVPEEDIIDQILRNLNPYYADRVALHEIGDLNTLKELCRKVKNVKSRSDKYKPPTARVSSLLEPDLACLSVADTSREGLAVISGTSPTVMKEKCFNCLQLGHRHRQCPLQATLFCYGCGLKGFYRTNCPACVPKNGQTGTVLNTVSHLNVASRNTGAVPKVVASENPVRPSVPKKVAQSEPSTSRQ